MTAMPTTIEELPVDSILVGQRIRPIDQGRVDCLADNIGQTRLHHAITVYPLDDEARAETGRVWGLVSGAHRLVACAQLGWPTISATVVIMGEHERIIAECDENLLGTNLSQVERAILTKCRKEAYEALHPETRNGAVGNGRGKVRQLGEATRFTADMAQKTGKSERAIQRDARRGESISPEILAAISGTDLDQGTVLDELVKTPPEAQAAKLSTIASKRASRQGPALADSQPAVESSAAAPDAVDCEAVCRGSPAAKWLFGQLGDEGAVAFLDLVDNESLVNFLAVLRRHVARSQVVGRKQQCASSPADQLDLFRQATPSECSTGASTESVHL